MEATVTTPSGDTRGVDLVRTGPTLLEGRFVLEGPGAYRPVVRLGDGSFLRADPLALPYSPEFAPRRDPGEGEALLRRVAALTGGAVDPPSGTLFAGPREGRAPRSLLLPFALAALVVFLLEILVRRTAWAPSVPRRLRSWRLLRASRTAPAPPATPAPSVPPAPEAPDTAPAAPPPATPAPVADIASVLDRARKRRG
jgi:hypothetical protein